MIEVEGFTKNYGSKTAVHNLSFTVRPGKVTGFLGPNGSGKSTTMRMIMGLDQATEGSARINGKRLRDAKAPLSEIGALLDAKGIHPGRSARNHLLALAQTNGVPAVRVDHVLELVGLSGVARRRAGAFSLGMGQRLGIAGALLGDPKIVMLDEPVNGLDPDGILWIRNLMKGLAAEGRTVFVSSHLMSEMALTADHLVVIGRGELIADSSVDAFIAKASHNTVVVRSPAADQLRAVLTRPDVTISSRAGTVLEVSGLSSEEIGETASLHRITLHELAPKHASLEEAFMELTGDSVEYRSTQSSDSEDPTKGPAA